MTCPYCVQGVVSLRTVHDRYTAGFACQCQTGRDFQRRTGSTVWGGNRRQWKKTPRGSEEYELHPDMLGDQEAAVFAGAEKTAAVPRAPTTLKILSA